MRASNPKVRTDLTFRPAGGRLGLFDRRGTRTHLLNLTAALVWTQCDGRNDPSAIASAVATSMAGEADTATIQADVKRILRQFARDGLLT